MMFVFLNRSGATVHDTLRHKLGTMIAQNLNELTTPPPPQKKYFSLVALHDE